MKLKTGIRTAVIIGIALLLIVLPLLGACAKEKVVEVPVEKVVEKEVIKEVPVEKVVEKEVIKEVPAEERWVKMLDLTDLTGPVGGILTPISEGLTAYFDHVNNKGGVEGVKVNWIVVDTQYKPAVAQSAYERMKEGSILALTYAFMMDWFVEVSKRDKKVIFSASPTPRSFFPAQPYIFGVGWMPENSAAGIKWFKENMFKEARPMRVAMIYTDAPAGMGYILGVPKWCTEQGIEVVKLQPVPLGVTDMSAELMAVERAKPDLIIFSMTIDGAIIGLRNRYDLGIKTPAMTNAPGDLAIGMKSLGPEPVEGVNWVCFYAVEEMGEKYPWVKKGTEWWYDKHPGIKPVSGSFYTGMAYAMIIEEALQRTLEKVSYEELTGEALKTYGFDTFTEPFPTEGLHAGFDIKPGVDHLGLKKAIVVTAHEGKLGFSDYFATPTVRPPDYPLSLEK